jgi:Uma2 family endonuclease
MSAAQKLNANYLTEDQYLERERQAFEKSEYIAGAIYAMAGGSVNHSSISANCIITLGKKLPKGCRVLTSDMRIYNPHTGSYLYPDVSVVCGTPDIRKGECLVNPAVIIEVLSPSTENRDRTTKLRVYTSISSLQEVVLIAQERREVDVFRKNAAGRWEYFPMEDAQAGVELASLGCVLEFDELYANTDVDDETHNPQPNTTP